MALIVMRMSAAFAFANGVMAINDWRIVWLFNIQ